MHHHKLETRVKNVVLLFRRWRSQWGLIWLKYDGFYYIFSTANPSATILSLVVIMISWSVFWKDCFSVFTVKVTVKVCPHDVFWTKNISSQTKYVNTSSWAKVSFGEDSYIIKILLFPFSSELLILLQQNLVWWYININQSVLWKTRLLSLKSSRFSEQQNGCHLCFLGPQECIFLNNN